MDGPAPKATEEGVERPAKEGDHYSIVRKIGEGSFGVIYLGKSDLCPSEYVAIKFESRKSVAPQLRDEYRTYKNINSRLTELRKDPSYDKTLTEGIPKVYYYGQEILFNYLILDVLGDSLEDKFDRCGRRFSVKTTAFLAIQMISRVQIIHKNSYIYRDIKPDNFLLGRKERGEERLLYVVDFGMAKHFENPATRQHIPYREKKSLSGTARYMSINTHLGREQSRRDDMEALGNVILYFLRGSLPWQGLKARDNREKYEKIGQKKQSIRVEELCAGFPIEFAKYVNYVRKLAFEEEPDYELCKSWFQTALDNQKLIDGNEDFLDWEKIERKNDQRHSISHYESPKPTPNHLPLTTARTHAGHATASNVTGHVGIAPITTLAGGMSGKSRNNNNNNNGSSGNALSPPQTSGGDTKKSFLRRIFCFSSRAAS